MKKIVMLVIALSMFIMADSYTLSLVTDGGQGTTTFPSATSFKYQHDGSIVPTNVVFVLDSIEIKATDEAGNTGIATMFIKITPVNDQAPFIKSDTLTVQEGKSTTFTPTVTDGDNI